MNAAVEFVLKTLEGETVGVLRDVERDEAVEIALKEQWERGEELTLRTRREGSRI